MKKNGRFLVLPTINLKNVINVLCVLACSITVIFSFVSHIGKNIDSEFVSFVLNAAIKNEYKPEKSIAAEVIGVCVPSIELIPKVQTEVIAENKVTPPTFTPEPLVYTTPPEINLSDYIGAESLFVNNLSGKAFDKVSLLNKETPLTLTDEPTVLILHTHTSESYAPSEKYNYTASETGRTLDPNFNVTAIGDIIYQILTDNQINAIHDKTVNDYPSYSQSYSKSLKLASSYIEKYPSIKMVIDVHRDALGTGEKTLAPFDPSSAQVMLVVGTNASGLDHSNWSTNLSFALKLQREMNSIYPSLARPINLRRERFNQHITPYSFILEVGTNTNTLDEAKKAAEYFSLSLVSLLKV